MVVTVFVFFFGFFVVVVGDRLFNVLSFWLQKNIYGMKLEYYVSWLIVGRLIMGDTGLKQEKIERVNKIRKIRNKGKFYV